MNGNKGAGMGGRTAIAIVLSFGLMLLFNVILSPEKEAPVQQPQKEQTVQQEKKETPEKETESRKSAFVQKEEAKQEAAAPAQKGEPEKIVKRETGQYLLEFSSKGGILKKILLKNYLREGGKFIEISPRVEGNIAPLYYEIQNFNFKPDYKVEEKGNGNLVFYQEHEGLRIEKEFGFSKDSFHIELQVRIRNLTDKTLLTEGTLRWGKSIGPFLPEDRRTRYDEEIITSYFDRKENSEEEISDNTIARQENIDWVEIDNRYFIVALIPDKAGEYQVKIENRDKVYEEQIAIGNRIQLEGGKVYEKSYTVYMGPKNETYLENYGRNLDSITERGFAPITLIGKGIKYILFWINSWVSNFGIAIILLSLLFKIVLNPLTQKSMESSKRMQALQPQVEAIKKKFKDKPQEMNQKIWALYKKEKANPASGCLPLLLQMPFFFALYQTLPYIVELQNVNFLWINDLSSPDTVAYLSFFKDVPLLPYKLNILPLLLSVFSFFQAKVSQGGHANTGQGKMMEWMMPGLFLFIFWNMPSGLVLYWLMQTLFTIGHQYYINKRPPKKKEEKQAGKKKIAHQKS
jgi:YidC/Oxa1 family membrane protein insertase